MLGFTSSLARFLLSSIGALALLKPFSAVVGLSSSLRSLEK